MTAYTAMSEYIECKKFMDELKELNELIGNNAVKKDDTVTISLSHDDFLSIRIALTKSGNIVCSYKDTICKTMACMEMPDTLV